MRILYSSNAFWCNSGYGVQGGHLLPRLATLPEINGRENIAMFAWYGLHGGVHNVDGFLVYPGGADPYGNDVLEAHAKDFQASVIITLIDAWVLRDTAKKLAPALWLPWLPIDHEPAPQAVVDALAGAHMPLSFSKHGVDQLAKVGITSRYMPMGVDPNIYGVITDRDRVAQFRRELAGDDCTHLAVMVAANKDPNDRKAFAVQLRAWAKFAADKPGARLYLHTEPTPMYGGLDLVRLVHACGIADKVRFPDRYQLFKGLPPQYLALVYNAADVLLSASMSEGFGVPIIEAQACGTPVIVNDFASMPELVRWGYKLQPADLVWTAQQSFWCMPDIKAITEALQNLHDQQAGEPWPPENRVRCALKIHNEFAWDHIVRDHWAPLMREIAPFAPGNQSAIAQTLPAATPHTNGENGRHDRQLAYEVP